MGPRYARRILGVCTRMECEFWDAGCCVCARRVIECASWSEGSGLVYEGAPGCPACRPDSDCYMCACATAVVPARPPPDPRFAPLTVRPRKRVPRAEMPLRDLVLRGGCCWPSLLLHCALHPLWGFVQVSGGARRALLETTWVGPGWGGRVSPLDSSLLQPAAPPIGPGESLGKERMLGPRILCPQEIRSSRGRLQ